MEGISIIIWMPFMFISVVPKLVCSQESPGGSTKISKAQVTHPKLSHNLWVCRTQASLIFEVLQVIHCTGKFEDHSYLQYDIFLHLAMDRAAYTDGVRKGEHVCSNGQHLSERFKLELKVESETTVSHPKKSILCDPPGERSNFKVVEINSGEKGNQGRKK